MCAIVKLYLVFFLTFCGITLSTQRTGRVRGGFQTTIEQAPYHVTILKNDLYNCGGSLISYEHVITAAHCVYSSVKEKKVHSITIVSGRDVLTDPGQKTYAKNVYIPKKYTIPKYQDEFDIAIILLHRPFKPSNKVQLVKLPTEMPEMGLKVKFTGFGLETPSGNEPSKHLKTYDSKIIDCMTHVPQIYRPTEGKMICVKTASEPNRPLTSACSGDSGGPLVSADLTLVGVMSRGWNCDSGFPDMYTNVYQHIKFIDRIVPQELKYSAILVK